MKDPVTNARHSLDMLLDQILKDIDSGVVLQLVHQIDTLIEARINAAFLERSNSGSAKP